MKSPFITGAGSLKSYTVILITPILLYKSHQTVIKITQQHNNHKNKIHKKHYKQNIILQTSLKQNKKLFIQKPNPKNNPKIHYKVETKPKYHTILPYKVGIKPITCNTHIKINIKISEKSSIKYCKYSRFLVY